MTDLSGLKADQDAVTTEEWQAIGDPGNGYPSYRFVWRGDEAEFKARDFVQDNLARGGWADGPHLQRRTVTVTPWEDIPVE